MLSYGSDFFSQVKDSLSCHPPQSQEVTVLVFLESSLRGVGGEESFKRPIQRKKFSNSVDIFLCVCSLSWLKICILSKFLPQQRVENIVLSPKCSSNCHYSKKCIFNVRRTSCHCDDT